MSMGKVLLGAMIGIATGVALGVLLAPNKGSATRRKLSKQGTQHLDDLRETATECVDTLEENLDSIRETAVDSIVGAKRAVDSLEDKEPRSVFHWRPGSNGQLPGLWRSGVSNPGLYASSAMNSNTNGTRINSSSEVAHSV